MSNKEFEVLGNSGDGNHGQDWWSRQYDNLNSQNHAKELVTFPDEKENVGSLFARASWKNERQANAALRLWYRHEKNSDIAHQRMLIGKIGSTVGQNGRGRVEMTFALTNLLAADMYRATLGLPKVKRGESERVVRGSDFRQDGRPPDGGITNQG